MCGVHYILISSDNPRLTRVNTCNQATSLDLYSFNNDETQYEGSIHTTAMSLYLRNIILFISLYIA